MNSERTPRTQRTNKERTERNLKTNNRRTAQNCEEIARAKTILRVKCLFYTIRKIHLKGSDIMDELLMNIDLNNIKIQSVSGSILYLAKRLLEVTTNTEPNNDDLKKCYYEADNIADLIIDCANIISEAADINEKLILEARAKPEK